MMFSADTSCCEKSTKSEVPNGVVSVCSNEFGADWASRGMAEWRRLCPPESLLPDRVRERSSHPRVAAASTRSDDTVDAELLLDMCRCILQTRGSRPGLLIDAGK